MITTDNRILVTGATGTQGGATLTQLRACGYAVRALTRTPHGAAAAALRAHGAEVVYGDYDDPASLDAALAGVRGVFSVQVPSIDGGDTEQRQAYALLAAAQRAGVEHVVQSSVSGTDLYAAMPAGTEPLWDTAFWQTKWAIEQAVRTAGFPVVTILRPAFFLESFLPPKVAFSFPELQAGELVIAMQPDTPLAVVAAHDIGGVAALAFAQPERFNGQAIDLAGDRQTMPALAALLSKAMGRPITARCLTPEEAIARGKHPTLVQHQAWANSVGYPADPARLQADGIVMTNVATWVARNQDAFRTAP